MRETKHRRSQKSLKQSIAKFEKDTVEVKQQPYLVMSQKGFWDGGKFDNSFEVTTLVMLSLYRIEGTGQDKITTYPITIDMLVDRYNVLAKRSTKIKDKFAEALTSLVEKGLIKIREDKGTSSKKYFTVEQMNVIETDSETGKDKEVFRFFQMESYVVSHIIHNSASDNDRGNLLAMYASLTSQMNNGEVDLERYPDTWLLMQLMNHLSLASAEALGARIGIKNKTTATKYIDLLVEMKAIYQIKVHKEVDEGYKWSSYFSKYSERNYLIQFVSVMLLNTGFIEPLTGARDYRWANIDDVWDENIHGEGAKSKAESVLTTETANQSDDDLELETASQELDSVDDLMSQVQARIKPKLNIEVDDFAQQFIMEDDDEEDFFLVTARELIAEMSQ